MAQQVRIDCINKTDRPSRHERISHVGGRNANGTNWRMTEDAAIAGIENGTWEFYVTGLNNSQVKVVIEVSAGGHKYLKTKADTTTRDNLLSLPECGS